MKQLSRLERPIRILLVEDNPDDAKLTELAFQSVDLPIKFQVVDAGDEALKFLFREQPYGDAPRPDLILLDLNMPGTDGRDVLRRAKEDSQLRRIPVIVLTTSEADVDLLLSYSLHANAYLTKPIGMDEWDIVVSAVSNFWLRLAKYPPDGRR